MPAKPLAFLVGVSLGFFAAHAADLRPTGMGLNVALEGAPLAVELRPEIMDLSAGTWSGIPPQAARTESAGARDLRLAATYPFPSGQLEVFLDVECEPQSVAASLRWQGDAAGPGFGKLDLWLPEEAASDLVIEVAGKPIFTNWDAKPIRKGLEELLLRRASTGEKLLVIEPAEGAFPRVEIFFEEQRKDRGLFVRLFNVDNPNASDIRDASRLDCRIHWE